MRNPLNKRLKRDFKHNAGRYIAISLMLVVSIALISGFLVVADGIKTSFKENHINCKVEDGSFSAIDSVSEDTITEVEKLGLSVYENYYIDEDILSNITIRVYQNRERVNLATAMKGKLPTTKNEIAIDRLFAENKQLDIGEAIEISGTKMKITGLISIPDYSSLFKKNSDMMMDANYFCVAVVNKDTFDSFSKSRLIYNYAYYFDDRDLTDKEKIDLSNEIKQTLVEKGTQLTNFCTAENNRSVSFVEEDMGSDVPMMKVFLFIILGIMAFVFTVVIGSTIEEEAAIIGTLLASGYSKWELIRHYISLPIWVTFISGVIGNVLGYAVMPNIFKGMYYGSYSLPPMQIGMSVEALLLTTILPIVLMVGINLLVLNSKLSISPLNFLRHNLKKHTGKKTLKLPNFSFVNRFRLRVITQNKGSYITLFFGMLFASFILMFGLCITPMISHYVDEVKSSIVSDYSYILKTPVELENGESSEKFMTYSLETYYNLADKNLEVSFYGINKNSKYFKDLSIAENQSGCFLSDGLAKKIGAEMGDMITFTDPYSDKQYKLKVIGIYQYSAGLTAFMNDMQLKKMLDYDSNYFNGYLSNEKLQIDEKFLASVITSNDMVKLGNQMLSSFGQMAPMCTIAAIIIYLALMYILTKIVIDKNAVHISLMKVFGYEEKEIHKLYLNATTITVIVSLILTLPLVYVGIRWCFLIALMKMGGYIEAYMPPYLFAMIVAIGIVSFFAINSFHIKRVNNIEMSLALKDKE